MSMSRERGVLLRPAERLHNLVKSAPNLDNKSRSSTSTYADHILGNSVDHCDAPVTHHFTNTSTNYHSIIYDKDLMKVGGEGDDEHREMSSVSIASRESYDSDNSEHSTSVGCFSFVNSSSSEGKKKYKKLPKAFSDLENRQLLPEKKLKPSNSRKNSAEPKKKIQFEELTPKTKFNVDLMFYKRFEQSLDAVGSYELDEEDIVYIRTKKTKSKTKLSVRLQQSMDAIDSYEIEDEAPEKIYSKSIDDLSTGSEYQFHRNGSQFTWECFLKSGGRKNVAYEDSRVGGSQSSHESKQY